jgi:hypothetical protein
VDGGPIGGGKGQWRYPVRYGSKRGGCVLDEEEEEEEWELVFRAHFSFAT